MAKALLFENSEKIVSSERVLLINITEIIHCFLKSSPRRCDKKIIWPITIQVSFLIKKGILAMQ
jgi:hypothetical protein